MARPIPQARAVFRWHAAPSPSSVAFTGFEVALAEHQIGPGLAPRLATPALQEAAYKIRPSARQVEPNFWDVRLQFANGEQALRLMTALADYLRDLDRQPGPEQGKKIREALARLEESQLDLRQEDKKWLELWWMLLQGRERSGEAVTQLINLRYDSYRAAHSRQKEAQQLVDKLEFEQESARDRLALVVPPELVTPNYLGAWAAALASAFVPPLIGSATRRRRQR